MKMSKIWSICKPDDFDCLNMDKSEFQTYALSNLKNRIFLKHPRLVYMLNSISVDAFEWGWFKNSCDQHFLHFRL